MTAAVASAGEQRPLNGYMCDVCKKTAADVKKYDFELEPLPADFKSPTEDKSALPNRFLGHFFADYAPDLQMLGLKKSDERLAADAPKIRTASRYSKTKCWFRTFTSLR